MRIIDNYVKYDDYSYLMFYEGSLKEFIVLSNFGENLI